MAVSSLQLDSGLASLAAGLLPISAPWSDRTSLLNFVQEQHQNGESEVFSHRGAKVRCGESQASSREESMTSEEMQELSWQLFFSDPSQWWDNRRDKNSPRHPDFRHNSSKDALWLSNWYKPDGVDSQLALWDAGMGRPPGFGSASIQGAFDRATAHEGELDIETCRILCETGQVSEAVRALNLLVLRGRHVPDDFFYRVLKRCISQRDLVLGRRIHALTVVSGYKGNAFLATQLIGLYASHGRLEEAMGVFSEVTPPSGYNWASIIFAYARHGQPTRAISLYRQMCDSTVKPDSRTFVAVLKACASAGDLAAGKDVHAHILATVGMSDIFVQTGLVDMYAKCGSLEDARRVFDRLSRKDVVTWTAMIAGYAQQGMGLEALSLYSSMQQEGITLPDPVTIVCLLQACASVGVAALHQGKQLHAQTTERVLQTDVVLGTSLVNMYAKCGSLVDARSIFDRLPHKNVVTWTTMIAGYAQQGMGQEALALYSSMEQEGLVLPNSFTFVCLLHACANAAALPLGKRLHAQIEEQGLQADVVVGSSLVHMYAKCGSMVDSHQVFDSLPGRQISAWSSLIAGYTRQGDSETVFDLLDRMRLEGIQPDGITFSSVLTVCSHSGFVDKGRKYFEDMSTYYGITPTMEHYTCMIDLLGRIGRLDEALQVLKTMPFQPDVAAWLTLLGACQKWSDVEVGQQAFESAVRLDEKDASAYVLMSNIYAGAQMWEEAKKMQAMRVKYGACKHPGRSWWTDMGGVVHAFDVGDTRQKGSEGVYTKLQ